MASLTRNMQTRAITTLMGRGLPKASHQYAKTIESWVEMRDGVKLMTYISFPRGEDPWPVILIRNPFVL